MFSNSQNKVSKVKVSNMFIHNVKAYISFNLNGTGTLMCKASNVFGNAHESLPILVRSKIIQIFFCHFILNPDIGLHKIVFRRVRIFIRKDKQDLDLSLSLFVHGALNLVKKKNAKFYHKTILTLSNWKF